jgi:3-methyladenine DNA glycosylase AlkD
MNLDEVMAKLEALGNESMRKMNAKNGSGDNQFGVKMGDLRILAKEIKLNPELATKLWATGNWDARLLATQLMKPKQLSAEEVDGMVRDVPFSDSATTSQLADWLMTNVVRLHPQKEELRLKWMADDGTMVGRAGWSLTAERISKSPEGLDVSSILDRIENEMGSAPAVKAWTMNYSLAEIGINFPEHRARAIAIAEKIGAFRDYPVSKGCTSPFAPIWIDYFVSRQG